MQKQGLKTLVDGAFGSVAASLRAGAHGERTAPVSQTRARSNLCSEWCAGRSPCFIIGRLYSAGMNTPPHLGIALFQVATRR